MSTLTRDQSQYITALVQRCICGPLAFRSVNARRRAVRDRHHDAAMQRAMALGLPRPAAAVDIAPSVDLLDLLDPASDGYADLAAMPAWMRPRAAWVLE